MTEQHPVVPIKNKPLNQSEATPTATRTAPAPARTEVRPPETKTEAKTQTALAVRKLSPQRQLKLAVTRVVIVLATVLSVRYFFWRALSTVNPVAKVFFYVFLAAELMGFLETLLFYFVAWNPTHYARPKPIEGRSVDVFIPTYNEPLELLRETVMCARNMTYPHKTYVLDDGKRDEVRALAREFNCGYITRDNNQHAKAGNLNNALAQTSGEFIVTLDADHIASPGLIEELIGFFADERIAIVQANQDFYNLDSFQHQVNWKKHSGWQQQELFFTMIQPGKDRHEGAFFCGSPGIVRRKALEEVGGFTVGTITEDMHTSLRLQKKGWRVLYHNHTVARGLAPQTFTGFATQWYRWGQGAMQVMRAEKPLLSKGLTWRQKLCYFGTFYFYWMSYPRLFLVLTPIISLLFGVFPLYTDPQSYAIYFLPYFLLTITSSVLLQGGFFNFIMSEEFNLLKMHVLMKTISGLFKGEGKFSVTPKARAASARVAEVLLPSTLLVVLLGSLGAGIFRILHAPAYGYMFWALAVNIFWALVFVLMLGAVLQRSLGRKELRSSYRFPAHVNLPVKVTYPENNGVLVNQEQFAENLNRSGVAITLERAIPRDTPVKVELLLPGHTIEAGGKVMRNYSYTANGLPKVANGIRFDQISLTDQDEISKYLFWEVAPRENEVLNLTHETQAEEQHV